MKMIMIIDWFRCDMDFLRLCGEDNSVFFVWT